MRRTPSTSSRSAAVVAKIGMSRVDGSPWTAGNTVRSDDSSYGGNDSLIIQYLPAGSYKLAARDASSTAGGLYEVDAHG